MGSSTAPVPKVVLFDIGGVCVLSPMQAILDYERRNGLPDSWINHAIRYASPNGHWQRLERGEIALDADFFKGFTADLQDEKAWKDFNEGFSSDKKKLKDVANPTQLGDHVSLKAESADSTPTDQDRGSHSNDRSSPSPSSPPSETKADPPAPRPSLSKLAKDTTIGDPVSLESEDVVEPSEPQQTVSSAASLRQIRPSKPAASPTAAPSSPPQIDGEALFWNMMESSRHPDPYIFPAVQRLCQMTPRPIIAALSNTVNFPHDHPWNSHLQQGQDRPSSSSSSTSSPPPPAQPAPFNPSTFFDVYIASADVGMRKPSREIYELALRRINEHAGNSSSSSSSSATIRPDEILFLDDIGENLKTAREVGMRTIRVQMGKTWRAVKELETVLQVELMDEKVRRSKL